MEITMERLCRGCGQELDPKNQDSVADGCPCNTPRGVNHGLVPRHTCICTICDPEQTGSVRINSDKQETWRDKQPLF